MKLAEQARAEAEFTMETLVRVHQAYLFRLALSILDDPQEAEDAVQEAFIAAVRALDGFRGQSLRRAPG